VIVNTKIKFFGARHYSSWRRFKIVDALQDRGRVSLENAAMSLPDTDALQAPPFFEKEKARNETSCLAGDCLGRNH
jgi:hypothetical protein